MTAAAPGSSPITASDAVLNDLVEEFANKLQAGEPVDLQAYALQHPDHAEQLLRLLPAVQVLANARRSPASADPPGAAELDAVSSSGHVLGDYRIVREIGRGGMGVVYEAEQQSLGRRVALKVLRRHPGQDARMLARFRRESRAAAQLHHSNIVPVFEVGQTGDRCYYAMQFIRGQALDEVFRELQRLHAASVSGGASEVVKPAEPLAQSLWTGAYEPAGGTSEPADPESALGAESRGPAELSAAALPDRSELSSVASNYRRYCRNVALLGLQAAEALAYAHARGIIHRDIKPANLLLDTTGLLWVSDFGLVKTQDPALTDTGDFVGTLRYMAPERFRGECDARADVYALGLTLYELLVLRPAFDGQDRLHLVEQIGRQEPPRLRTLEPRIPRDLETILMKAIEKDPRRRYASAEALAGDLRHFLADEPVQARRIGSLERLGRWGRRNPLVAGLSAAVVLVAALGFVGVFDQWQVALAHEQQANQERDDAQALNTKLQATQDQLRRTLYAAHMNLAHNAWGTSSIRRVVEMLEQHRPKPGETDLRGFEWYYLDRLCHSDLLTFKGHKGAVMGVAFSPDGKRLASASGDGTVKVWDAQTGQELLPIKAGGYIRSVAFSPDGKRLASFSGPLKVWDAQTGQQLLSLEGGTASYSSTVVFSPDGKRLASASGGSDPSVKIWDAQTGRELLAIQRDRLYGDANVVFSPDGKRLASGSQVWDAQTGQELLSLKGGGNNLAFSPDDKRLASATRTWGSGEGGVKVLDAQTGQELLTLKGAAREGITGLAFSPDGKLLAGGSWDETIRLWDAETGRQVARLQGHMSGIDTVAFSPDGQRLASASRDTTVKVWQTRALTNQEALTLKGGANGVWGVAFSPDGKRLASASRSGNGRTVKVWDAQTGQDLLTLEGHTRPVWSVAFSPDGKRVASGGGMGDSTVKVWDTQAGQELLSLQGGHTGDVLGVAFSPDGKRLASASDDSTVKVWDAQSGQSMLTLTGLPPTFGNFWPTWSVAFSQDGKRLASGCEGQVNIWDAQTGQVLLTMKGPRGPQGAVRVPHMGVAFSADGKRLASGHRGEIKLWDALTGEEILTFRGHTNQIPSVVFSPDGHRLASCSHDGTVMVWDTHTGQDTLTLTGHTDRVCHLVFSPDGHRLASNGPDGTVKIWDATPLSQKP
jgi:WD40 repeat protein/serine/threonine protein kinase